MKLWQIGLLVFVLAAFLNGVLINFHIGGILRELMRLVVLIGLLTFIIGLMKRTKNKTTF